MAYSIYHFFVDLCRKKQEFLSEKKLESFPFDGQMLSCINKGKFPDLAVKLNNSNEHFTGGELIELKDSLIMYCRFIPCIGGSPLRMIKASSLLMQVSQALGIICRLLREIAGAVLAQAQIPD